MKKIFFCIVTLVTFVSNGNAQDLSLLKDDLNFKNYFENEIKFNSNFDSKNINLLLEINKDGILKETELQDFYKLFSTNEEEFNLYQKNQKENMDALEKKYNLSKYSQKELDEILIPILNNVYSQTYPSLVERKNCRARYLAELSLAASVAYGAHMACNAAVFGGPLAFYACHGAVTVGQTAASYIALDNYYDCIKQN